MKVSVNWIQQFLAFELPAVDELVQKIGSQLGEVEEVVDLGKKYQGIFVAKVVECLEHEDSDHLNVCKIDDGGKAQNIDRDENGLVQVVCGAPNVREGLLVAWLPPGSTVPSSFEKDPFVLEAREIRGQKSSGMLASAKELAISDDHEGILEIDKDAAPGDNFAETYKLDDTIIDIENKMFTHRPDCFGALGVAREIAGIYNKPFTDPDWYWKLPAFADAEGLELEIFNEAKEKVPRFMAVALKNVEVKPSPLWLQVALAKLGQKSINNIVDLTNYYMLVTAQPLHAYDYDKLRGHKLGARLAQKDEKCTLLNRKTYELNEDDIVIADGEGPVGLAGIMGGGDSEVSLGTKNIVIECANFDMYSVRKSSMRHGLFTDAVTRFSKGQSPLQCDRVLLKIMESIQESAHSQQASKVFDVRLENNSYDNQTLSGTIAVRASFVNQRLGLELSNEDICGLLKDVHFSCYVEEDSGDIAVTAPFWRTDIEIPEDIVEEVGRLYGYDKLTLELPKRSINPAQKDEPLEIKAKIRDALSKAGANEVLTYSFVHGNLLDKVGQDKNQAYQISNALSPDLQYYRLSLMPSLLDKIHANIKAGYDEFALFELGKVHIKDQLDDEKLPREDELTALVVVANDKLKMSGAAYYRAKKYLANLLGDKLTLQSIPESMQKFDITKPYDKTRAAFIYTGGSFLGIIGEFRSAVSKNLKLPRYCAGFELDTLALAKILNDKSGYIELPRFPKITQDICLKVASDLSYQDLASFVESELGKIKSEQSLLEISPLDIYQREDDQAHKQITFRIQMASHQKTMTAAEVSKLLDQLAAAAQKELAAERV